MKNKILKSAGRTSYPQVTDDVYIAQQLFHSQVSIPFFMFTDCEIDMQ